MGETRGDRAVPGDGLIIGSRVLVRRNAGGDVIGEVVADYAALTEPGGSGHEWAPAHRWAIALDDGRLIFADTVEVTVDPSPR